jgi:universal stress protein A
MKIKLSRPLGNVIVDLGDKSVQLKKILVPVDFSACSKKALQYAIPFAKQFGAKLVLLHVIPMQFHYSADGFETETISAEEAQADVARKLCALIKELVPAKIPARVEIRHGVEAAEIVNEAKKIEADIVILSTHGRTGRAHSLVGSVAEDVVRLAPCPVLVVRERQHEFVKFQTATKTISANAA